MQDILENFRRYRRACREYPDYFWPERDLNDYDADRKVLKDAYASKRREGYGVAVNYAHEELFLRCFGLK